MMMKAILSKHSMKTLFTGYIKYAGELVVVLLSVGQGGSRSSVKALRS